MTEIGNEALNHYHETLLASEKAKAYLRERGLYSDEAIKHFRLGYCDGSFSPTLPDRQLVAGRKVRGELASMGLLDDRGHEKFRPCIVFPITDEHGRLVQAYGRKTSKTLKSKRYHEYLNDRRDVLWNLDDIRHNHEVIVCEGLTDALSFWIKGYRNVTAVFGPDAFTETHVETLVSLGVKRVYLAFDNDDAGNTGAKVAANLLQHHGLVPLRLVFPRGMDANRYAMKANLDDVIGRAETMADTTTVEPEPVSNPVVLQPEEKPVVATRPEPATRDQPQAKDAEKPQKVTEKGPVKIKGEEIFVTFDERVYRVRGLFRNLSVDSLKVNLRVSRGDLIFVDNLELYSSRQRQSFINQAALELGFNEAAIKRDLGRLIIELEKIQDGKIAQTLDVYEMTPDERQAALEFLRDPGLVKRIAADLDHSGLVGEEPNKLVGYLSMVSRKLAKPLAILIQSTSAAGKSSLLETLLSFIPVEDRLKYSSITPQSLYYMAEKGVKHKVLAVAEGEGAAKASYSLKLLQSEGELVISSTGGDSNGLASKEYRVEGPVMIAMTTTAVDIDEELLNRCIVLTVDETRQQTRAIHDIQRQNQTLDGVLSRKRFEATLDLHRNAQRLLRPVFVVNPYAPYLTFLDEKTRLRRDHIKYLSLIQAVAFLHQYQRPIHMKQVDGQVLEYIEVTVDDIKLANQLAHHVLGVTLDELPPHTRRLLEVIHRMVTEKCKEMDIPRGEYRFTRRDLRDYSQWGDTQLKVHLKRLVEHEYLTLTVQKRKHLYECLYNGEGQDSKPFLMGLVDTARLERSAFKHKRSESKPERSGNGRPVVGDVSADSRQAVSA